MNALSRRPALSTADAVDLVRRIYGLEATARALPSYADQNLRIDCVDGERYVLKLARSSERRAVLDLETRALEHLARSADARIFPRLKKTLDGAEIAAIDAAASGQHAVRLISSLPGTLLGEVSRPSRRLFGRIGAAVGRMDRVLMSLDSPQPHRFLVWDAVYSPIVIRQNLEAISDAGCRSLVASTLDDFEERCASHLHTLRRSLIHNDCNDWNLLVDGDDVTGIFDFGDMVSSFLVGEVAITMAYAMAGRDEPMLIAEAVLAGYHAELALTPSEVDVVFDLVRLRLCLSLAMNSRQRRLEPDNEYLSVSEAAAARLLALLAPLPADDVATRFRVLLGLTRPAQRRPVNEDIDSLSVRRQRVLGPSLSVSYREPLSIVRGRGPYLFDDRGVEYLDCVNNVCHVGHCHPRVVSAAYEAMATLNTNTRYLHPKILEYAERILATLPVQFEVCYFVNSGSEANELALRLARTHTGRRDIAVLDHGYHGNSQGLIDVSPYKFNGKGGAGKPPTTHVVPLADPYRGPWGRDDPDAGGRYAATIDEIARDLASKGRGIAALLAESISGCGGQVLFVDGFLKDAFERTRAAGGVSIADEVQVGFGRVGSHMWAFEAQGALPEIVTMGKPAGNGHPLGIVATTRAIAESFANGMEYFNTFGGNPVSCAVGLAVLDVIRDEDLRRHAHDLGRHFRQELQRLSARHTLIGDVRGQGLFLGVELVRDRHTKEPATAEASQVINAMRERRILLSTDGPHDNVIKIKPPMVLQRHDVDRVVAELDAVLGTLAAGS